LQQHGDQQERVALFSHAGFYNHFMSALLNITERQDLAPSQASIEALTAENVILSAEREAWFTMNNAAITRIDFTHDEIKICYQNRLDYLPPSLIT
jgi:broad specificity phosphatase PhoE